MVRAARTRPALERDTIVRRALDIADAEGLDAVSFRRLAADFGVTPMALYRHVRDKTDLVDAMADLVLAGVRAVPAPRPRRADWQAELRALVRSVGRVLDAHPSGAALLTAGSGTAPHALRLTELVLDILARAGFALADSMAIVQQLTTVVLGPRLLYGTAPDTSHTPPDGAPAPLSLDAFPRLRAALPHAARWGDQARSREFGLNLFIAGLDALLARRA